MDKIYIGIDVGSKGFLCIYYNGEYTHYSISDLGIKGCCDILRDLKESNVICAIEDVHSIYGSSSSATFTFGENKGILLGILTAFEIPYVLVQPKEWQKEIWGNSDMIVSYKTVKVKGKDVSKKVVNTKHTSLNAAKRLFPKMDFRRTIKCKNSDDNKVDATLICEYARRKNL